MLLSSPRTRVNTTRSTNLITSSAIDPTVRRCLYPVSIAFLSGVSFSNETYKKKILDQKKSENQGGSVLNDSNNTNNNSMNLGSGGDNSSAANQHLVHPNPISGFFFSNERGRATDSSRQSAQRQEGAEEEQQDQTVSFVHPSLFPLIAHHCYGTLRHVAVRTLADTILPLVLSHAGSTLNIVDARNCDKTSFSEHIAGQALLLQADPNILRVVDISFSTYDVYATPSDWEVFEAFEGLRCACSRSSPSLPADIANERGRLCVARPPRVHQPVAPATPLTNFKYFADSMIPSRTKSQSASKKKRREGGGGREDEQEEGDTYYPRYDEEGTSDDDDDDFSSSRPAVAYEPLADKNVRRPTARHNQNGNPSNALYQSPTSPTTQRIYSSSFIAKMVAKFKWVIYGSSQMWRAEVSSKVWRLQAFEQQLLKNRSQELLEGAKEGEQPQAAATSTTLSTAFMRENGDTSEASKHRMSDLEILPMTASSWRSSIALRSLVALLAVATESAIEDPDSPSSLPPLSAVAATNASA